LLAPKNHAFAFGKYIVALIAMCFMLTQNGPDRVPADLKMAAQAPNAPTIRVHGYQKMFQLFAVIDESDHWRFLKWIFVLLGKRKCLIQSFDCQFWPSP